MIKSIHLNLFFYIESVISLLLTTFSDRFLPEQFLRDSNYFEQRINSNITGYTDSFEFIVNLYTSLGITQATAGLRIIEWLLFFLALLQCRIRINATKTDFTVFLLSSVYLMLLPFYGSLFTKEIFIIIVINIYLLCRKMINHKYILLLIIVMQLVIIVSIRQYYLLTLSFMLFYLVMKERIYKFRILFPLVLITILSTLDTRTSIFSKMSGIDIFEIRNITNSGLRIIARSQITQSSLSRSPLENLESFSEVMMQILFPIQLLTFSLYSLFTFLAVIAINYSLCSEYLIKRYEKLSPEAVFLFAFFSTSLIFEPDLGSYVRHGFVFIPIVISIRNSRKFDSSFLKKIQGKRFSR